MKNDSSLIGEIASFISSIAIKVIAFALVILLLFECGKLSFGFGRSIFYQEPVEAKPGTDVVITFDKDDDMDSVAELLKDEGLIRKELPFVIQGSLYKISIVPGEYVLNTSMTTKEMLMKIEDTSKKNKELNTQETTSNEIEDGGLEIIGGAGDNVDEKQLEAARKSMEE
ncbi:MAG: hypothetical protein Q4B86_06680 [Eubacteriales bacterium]|nr:hypothetical protein [Eubacteriales bacterium]